MNGNKAVSGSFVVEVGVPFEMGVVSVWWRHALSQKRDYVKSEFKVGKQMFSRSFHVSQSIAVSTGMLNNGLLIFVQLLSVERDRERICYYGKWYTKKETENKL